MTDPKRRCVRILSSAFNSGCWRVQGLNDADVDDAGPDNAGACGAWARVDAGVSEVALPQHRDGADGAHRECGCVHAPGLRADVHARAAQQDVAKDQSS